MLKYPKTMLGIYAAVLTVAFGALLLMGARSPGATDFDTINCIGSTCANRTARFAW